MYYYDQGIIIKELFCHLILRLFMIQSVDSWRWHFKYMCINEIDLRWVKKAQITQNVLQFP